MGLLGKLFEQRSVLTPNSSRFWEVFGVSMGTDAGVSVSVPSSLTSTAVYACVRILAESTAQLPLITYRRRADGGKERAEDDPRFYMLKELANEEMTAFDLRETLMVHAATWGRAFAEIDWDMRAGYPKALWPLRPDQTHKRRVNGEIVYDVEVPGQSRPERLPGYRVLEIQNMGGMSPIKLHKEAIALSLATQEFGARFFGNGARPGGVLEHPGKLSPEAHKRLKDSWNDALEGLSNAHRMKILEEGMTYHQLGVPPEEAQFLETRKFQKSEIASIFRVPPHMIADLERATFSNIEHQGLEFVIHTLGPWLERIEQAMQRDLLVASERRSIFVEHNVAGLLRGDISSRYEAYMTGRNGGWLSVNDIRSLENMNPVDGGDTYLEPLNMAPAGSQVGDAASRSLWGGADLAGGVRREARAIAGERQDLARAQRALVEDAAGRIVRREVADIERAIQKYLVRSNDLRGFLLWLSGFYEEHEQFIQRNLAPTFEALSALVLSSVARELDSKDLVETAGETVRGFAAEFVAGLALRWVISNQRQLEALARESDVNVGTDALAEVLLARLNGWAESEAAKVAMRESVQAVNAMAKAGYRAAGVRFLRWNATGENCPYCRALDGKIVGIDDPFVEAGDYQPEGADAPIRIRRSVGHPPVHQGCDCAISAA